MRPAIPFTSLADMREQAWASARTASDPLTARQFFELAQSYDAALLELHETGITIVPRHDPGTFAFRSIPLWATNED